MNSVSTNPAVPSTMKAINIESPEVEDEIDLVQGPQFDQWVATWLQERQRKANEIDNKNRMEAMKACSSDASQCHDRMSAQIASNIESEIKKPTMNSLMANIN